MYFSASPRAFREPRLISPTIPTIFASLSRNISRVERARKRRRRDEREEKKLLAGTLSSPSPSFPLSRFYVFRCSVKPSDPSDAPISAYKSAGGGTLRSNQNRTTRPPFPDRVIIVVVLDTPYVTPLPSASSVQTTSDTFRFPRTRGGQVASRHATPPCVSLIPSFRLHAGSCSEAE